MSSANVSSINSTIYTHKNKAPRYGIRPKKCMYLLQPTLNF